MSEFVVLGTDLRIASDVTFIPGQTPDKNHAMVTAIANRGQSQNGQELRDEATLHFWNKNASVAAHYLYPGKQINVRGRLQSFTEDTGRIRADGKRELIRKNEIVVSRMELLGDSMKEIEARVAKNIASIKAAGRLPQEVSMSAEELLKADKAPMTDFNQATAAQTGRFGRAKVFSKNRGFWENTAQAGAPAAPNAQLPSDSNALAQLVGQLQTLMANQAGAAQPAQTEVNSAPQAPDNDDPF